MKLWSKTNTSTLQQVERFTVGRDREFDLLLAPYDVQGSLAHVQMLHSCGLVSAAERQAIEEGLHHIAADIEAGVFCIEDGVEDVHSQVELQLTRSIGEAGKKLHTGRSRNDQVALDIKLYLRSVLKETETQVTGLFDVLLQLSEQYHEVLMPGYTHLQVAMPSSFGLWFGAWAECLTDDMLLLRAAQKVTDKNPLGSGAGYGSAFPLDRELSTELLGFGGMCHNSIYAQMARGKTEKTVAAALASIAGTLSRLAMDICLFMGQNYQFFRFPDEWTTGSSLMPHKKNPDVFELVRARCNRIQSVPNELSLLLNNLPSGYHRDVQLSKEILFPAIDSMLECLLILQEALPAIEPRRDILDDERYRYIFTVEALNERVKAGVPFRDAYREVGDQVDAGAFQWDTSRAPAHTHTGSIGNPGTEGIRQAMARAKE